MADSMNLKQPLICIGREYGSGGREIAEKLAEKLGVPYYDKLLIRKAAEESGYTEHFLSQNEEQPFSIGSLLMHSTRKARWRLTQSVMRSRILPKRVEVFS